VVAAGDTLLAIARRFGVSVEALSEANGITDPDLVLVGQRLVIPLPTDTPGP
jgi:LysM repeat protein